MLSPFASLLGARPANGPKQFADATPRQAALDNRVGATAGRRQALEEYMFDDSQAIALSAFIPAANRGGPSAACGVIAGGTALRGLGATARTPLSEPAFVFLTAGVPFTVAEIAYLMARAVETFSAPGAPERPTSVGDTDARTLHSIAQWCKIVGGLADEVAPDWC